MADDDGALDLFGPATAHWFGAAFAAPTEVQRRGWAQIASGRDTLLISPTGSGKTLAAFLWAIDKVGRRGAEAAAGVRVLYISPLKALAYDVERNLRAPLVGIGRSAARLGLPYEPPTVSTRTGDTPASERDRFVRHPGEILVTTPESLYLLLGGRSARTFHGVHTVIIDEVHALAGTKRGAHLALSLERLDALVGERPQRVGLSATVRPVEEVARWLAGGGRVDGPRGEGAPEEPTISGVAVVDAARPPDLDLRIVVATPDMERPRPAAVEAPDPDEESVLLDYAQDGMGYGAFQGAPPSKQSIWSSIHPRLLELIRAHRSTIVFVNNRGLCERLARRLNELADEELVLAHHGSVSHEQRKGIEEALKEGRLRGIVATSSLELGIDMGAVDLVVLVESPGSTARGLQRIGRAGHGVGERSIGRLFPKFRGDLLEAAVVAERMLKGELEAIAVPRNPLDVLAQQLVAMCAVQPWTVEEAAALVRRAYPFAELSQDALTAVLDMLSGRFPSTDFADLRPRLDWDRGRDLLTARPGAKMVALTNGGTIPDRGLYGVHIAPDGPRVGELDEEMVHESRPGETFVLGATTWRIQEITRDRVLVVPAPGQPGRMPFWHGEGPGRPVELGRALGRVLGEYEALPEGEGPGWLQGRFPLNEHAANNLDAYLREQREATRVLPSDRSIVVERFRDELGDWRVCIHSPFGARVHGPWAMALEATLSAGAGFEVQTSWSDDGILFRLVATDDEVGLPDADLLVPEPEEVEDLVLEQLGRSALFAGLFRENAARSLLLVRARPGKRMPLWAQRIKSSELLATARRYPSFPVVLETYRSCLRDVFDMPALDALLRQIRARSVRVHVVDTETASPFARSLVFRFVGSAMYDGDAPLAERRAQALNLDRNLLRELLGHEELRELLDAELIAQVEAELQFRVPDRHARRPDALHDLLRRLGDLDDAELAERCEQDPRPWLEELQEQRRVAAIRVAGGPRWVAVEDVALYRDALGAVPPPGLPAAFLAPGEQPLVQLLRRYARTHGPFTTEEAAARFGLLPGQVEPVLVLEEEGRGLLRGGFRPGRSGAEWCDPAVLRRIRRRTLARLRGEVAPVETQVLASFLQSWQGVVADVGGARRRAPPDAARPAGPRRSGMLLEEVIEQLEGLPLSFRELEERILPARLPGFRPQQLDELGAQGELVWVGRGALGSKDGRVALYRRDHVELLPPPPEEAPDGPLHRAILELLGTRGACFLAELRSAARPGPDAEPPALAELLEALWELVWAGLVTNDTFTPLRTLGGAGPSTGGRRPGGRGARWSGRRSARAAMPTGGRWSLVEHLVGDPPADTERAHAWTILLLERYGVIGRETARAEGVPGGFSSIYPVLRALEDAGRVRRGYFVDGLGGAQFALPGAIDRLRAARSREDEPEVAVLAATDPANPYGASLPWPATRGDDGSGPRRVPGASVILADGVPVLFVGAGAKRVWTFEGAGQERLLVPAFAALGVLAATSRGRTLRVERVDGEPAQRSTLRDSLVRAGFTEDYRGMTLEVPFG